MIDCSLEETLPAGPRHIGTSEAFSLRYSTARGVYHSAYLDDCWGLVMLLAGKAVLLDACLAVGLPFSGMAQQERPQEPQPALPCDAFRKNGDGEWVANRNIMVPAPFGMVEIKAGQVVEEDLQERLDAQCK